MSEPDEFMEHIGNLAIQFAPPEKCVSLVEHRGTLYLATEFHVYELVGESFRSIEIERSRKESSDEEICYVLTVTYPHEFSRVLGVYSTKEKALPALLEAEIKDTSGGYNDFNIEEFIIT